MCVLREKQHLTIANAIGFSPCPFGLASISGTGAATAISGEEAREVRGGQQIGAWHSCTVCCVCALFRLPLYVGILF